MKKKPLIIFLSLVLMATCFMPTTVGAFSAKSDTTKQPLHLWGKDRYATSLSVLDQLFKENGKFDNIVLAYGGNFPDALSGGYFANVKGAPLVLVDERHENDAVQKITRYLKPRGTVYLLGGTGVIREKLAYRLGSLGFGVNRLFGPTRYETNLQILNACYRSGDELLIASGSSFPDSLSGSAVGKPLMLVSTALRKDQIRWLKNAHVSRFYILGGTGSVNKSVEIELRQFAPVERLGGQNRYETSTLIAARFFPQAKAITLVPGINFPDGLSGAPYAFLHQSPIVLISSNQTSFVKQFVSRYNIQSVAIIGGLGSNSNSLIKDILAHLQSETSNDSDDSGNKPEGPGSTDGPENPGSDDKPGTDDKPSTEIDPTTCQHEWEDITKIVHHDAYTEQVFVEDVPAVMGKVQYVNWFIYYSDGIYDLKIVGPSEKDENGAYEKPVPYRYDENYDPIYFEGTNLPLITEADRKTLRDEKKFRIVNGEYEYETTMAPCSITMNEGYDDDYILMPKCVSYWFHQFYIETEDTDLQGAVFSSPYGEECEEVITPAQGHYELVTHPACDEDVNVRRCKICGTEE